MRILYFSFVELDVPNACQVHTLGILSGFGENECKVDAVVPRPKQIHPNIPGVHFFYIWPWRFSPLGKLWVKLLGSIYFMMLCLLKGYDAIYVRELELNSFSRWCSRIFKIPYYIEINGILLFNTKVSDENRYFLHKIERNQRLNYHRAEGLIVTSFPRSRWLIDYYRIEPSKVYTIINGAKIPKNKKLDRKISLKRLNLPEKGFYLGFLGTVWKDYDVKSIIKAMALCKTELSPLYLVIIGGGPDVPYLKGIARNEGLSSKIIDLGFIQPNELFKTMGAIDIALMNLTAIGLKDLGPVTTRFATYAAFSIPVIANCLYLKNYPKDIIQGLFAVPHENPAALADMILWLYKHPEEREKNSRILQNYFYKNLTWTSVTKNILEIIKTNKELKDRNLYKNMA